MPPLDGEALERLALRYVERYATTCAKLKDYLRRKLRERGWAGEDDPSEAIDGIVAKARDLGYVDDEAFARARSASLLRRGYGQRRLDAALRAAGVNEEDSEGAREEAREGAWRAVLRFAERKRGGPYAAAPLAPDQRRKILNAILRAGHPMDLARRVVEMAPGDLVDPDEPNFP